MLEISELEQKVVDNLRQVIVILKKRLSTQPKSSNLSNPQLSALIYLVNNSNATVTELARNEDISVQSMGVHINYLKEQRLIISSKDPKDKRKLLLSLSENCRGEILEFKRISDLWVANKIREKLTDIEQEQLLLGVQLLEKIFSD